jgi:hypothetical protein
LELLKSCGGKGTVGGGDLKEHAASDAASNMLNATVSISLVFIIVSLRNFLMPVQTVACQ